MSEDLLDRALADLEARARQHLPSTRDEATDWFALFDELRSHVGQLGMRDRTGEIDDFGLDPEYLRSARPLLHFLRRRWFRLDAAGAGGLPDSGPLLLVANRSGILPWDGLMLSDLIAEHRDRPRFLLADWLITMPWMQPAMARLGGVRACPENAERLLQTGRSVIAFPEGQKGAGKLFRERYQLQRFGRGGVVRLALAAGVPIVPVGIVGAEEAHPILFKLETTARAVGLPFLPVTPTFPWLGPAGAVPLPAKWLIRFGPPIDTEAFGPEASDDDLLIARLNEELRDAIQGLVLQAVREREAVFG